MQISTYEEGYFNALHRSFNQAFSTSKHRFNLSEEDFRIRINHKIPIEPSLSFLFLDKYEVIGFLLQAKSVIRDSNTCYNAGIGIIPGHRKKGYGHLLLREAIEKAHQKSVHQMVLEVVDTNEAALKLYTAHGFTPTRVLHCFKRNQNSTLACRQDLKVSKNDNWSLKAHEEMVDFETGLTDSLHELKRNSLHETTMEAHEDGRLVGFVTFQPKIGRISKIGVKKDRRRNKIGTTLIYQCMAQSESKSLTILNIPKEQKKMRDFLSALGFSNEINQIEMIKVIGS